MTHRVFLRPRTVRDYGYIDGALVEQAGSSSGFLLNWDAIDDQAISIATGRPPMYVVTGEWERPDGLREPELAVAASYMDWAGYLRHGNSWRRAGAEL